jgi:PAS domain S-box-containing protein
MPLEDKRLVDSRALGDSATNARHDADAFRLRLTDSLLLAGTIFAFISIVFGFLRASGAPYPIAAVKLALPWLPLGAAAGAFYFRGVDRWPGAFAGVLIAGYVFYTFPFVQLVLQATATTLCAALVAFLLRIWRFQPSCTRARDPLLLWAAAGIGAAGLAVLSVALHLFGAWYRPEALGPAMARILLDGHGHPALSVSLLWLSVRWFANWMSGIALGVPCVHALVGADRQRIASHPIEKLAVAVLFGAWVLVAFSPLPPVTLFPLGLVALLLVVWSAIRFATGVTSSLTLGLTLAMSMSIMIGRGMRQLQPENAVVTVWCLVITTSAIGLLVSVLVAKRDAALDRYATLFESNPMPLWVQEPGSGRILIVNQAAVRRYGYSRDEFAQLSVADLDATGGGLTAIDAATAVEFDGGEYRHRTRDGEIIDVNIRTQPIVLDGREAELVFSYDVTERNRLRSAFIDASDRALREVGHELHDGLGQTLVGLSLITRTEHKRAARIGSPEAESFEQIDRIVQGAVQACRDMALGLSPLAETSGDLVAALRGLPHRFSAVGAPAISVDVEDEGDGIRVLPEATRDHVYRIAQEALTNAVTHAHARRIDIRLVVANPRILLTIHDDGVGVSEAGTRGSGLGFRSMRDRAATIGARLTATSLRGGGTEVRLER